VTREYAFCSPTPAVMTRGLLEGAAAWKKSQSRAGARCGHGHEDVKTTMKYLHPNTSGSAAVVNQRNQSESLHLLKPAG
jgi:hypothetical protein